MEKNPNDINEGIKKLGEEMEQTYKEYMKEDNSTNCLTLNTFLKTVQVENAVLDINLATYCRSISEEMHFVGWLKYEDIRNVGYDKAYDYMKEKYSYLLDKYVIGVNIREEEKVEVVLTNKSYFDGSHDIKYTKTGKILVSVYVTAENPRKLV